MKKFPKQLLVFLEDDGEGGFAPVIASNNGNVADLVGLVENGQKVARYGLLGVETFQINPYLLVESDGN